MYWVSLVCWVWPDLFLWFRGSLGFTGFTRFHPHQSSTLVPLAFSDLVRVSPVPLASFISLKPASFVTSSLASQPVPPTSRPFQPSPLHLVQASCLSRLRSSGSSRCHSLLSDSSCSVIVYSLSMLCLCFVTLYSPCFVTLFSLLILSSCSVILYSGLILSSCSVCAVSSFTPC
jgi:hypothetical protein